MNNKYTVKWTSQALGCEMEKCGEIISIIPQNESAYNFLPVGVKKSHIKFGDKSERERVLIQVKAGVNKKINHYYAPLRSVLERQGNSEAIRKFINA